MTPSLLLLKKESRGFVQEVEKNDPNVTVAEIWHLDDLDAISKEINAEFI